MKKYFTQLHHKMIQHLAAKKELWIRDCFACADENYRLKIACNKMKTHGAIYFATICSCARNRRTWKNFSPDWHIIQAPDFFAEPAVDGTSAPQFIIISFEKQTILIGGTAYTGEMKKGIFSVLNFLLPVKNNVLTMHCSANLGAENDVALFFGLSGTGKTTLSADASRLLIGDDEHAWTNEGIFNIEGGCYAKLIGLEKEKEPLIFDAIRSGALVENCCFINNTNQLDFGCANITENTRASYPLSYIANAVHPSLAGIPENIFFLTCDAYGILPPVSKLSIPQAMYYFISGYTAKVAGTETGVTEPKATFSACFGAPFIPLHPAKYAEMLGEKIKQHNVKVWMINTGWTAGAYGKGYRIPLAYTREIVKAVFK